MTRETVAVVITVHKPQIDELEALSLSRCVAVLGRYPLVFVGPRSLDFSVYRQAAPSAEITVFDDRWFQSDDRYNEFLVRPLFYEAFADCQFILKYELDAFVFEDQLLEWCDRDWGYVGAPWQHDGSGQWTGVGNGGFSLRKVSACLDVLHSKHKLDPKVYWEQVRHTTPNPLVRALKYCRKVKFHLGISSNVSVFLEKFITAHEFEDWFWGYHAARYYPSWRLAPVEEAMRFSVEAGLEQTASLFRERPPFGCHRRWFLEMLHRYLFSDAEPDSDYEGLVWDLARVAGLERQGTAARDGVRGIVPG